MYKKDLKLYVAPEMEAMDVEMESTLLDTSIDQGGNEWLAPGEED